MTTKFAINGSPASSGEAMYNIKELLVSCGWTVVASSDGVTYNSSGDSIGPTTLNTDLSWFRIRMPTYGGVFREYTVQSMRGTTGNGNFRVKYSPRNLFSGGSPGAVRTPSATDEQVLYGGGSDASPSGEQMFPGTDGTYRHNIVGFDAAPYSFVSWGWLIGPAQPYFMWGLDGLNEAESGDGEPFVHMTPLLSIYIFDSGYSIAQDYDYTRIANGLRTHQAYGTAAESFEYCGILLPIVNSGGPSPYAPDLGGVEILSGSDYAFPCYYARAVIASAPGHGGFRGRSSLFALNSVIRGGGDRTTLVTLNDGLLFRGRIIFPWDGSAVLL